MGGSGRSNSSRRFASGNGAQAATPRSRVRAKIRRGNNLLTLSGQTSSSGRSTPSAPTMSSCRRALSRSNTRFGSIRRDVSCCRPLGLRRCTNPRCSVSCPTRRSRSHPDEAPGRICGRAQPRTGIVGPRSHSNGPACRASSRSARDGVPRTRNCSTATAIPIHELRVDRPRTPSGMDSAGRDFAGATSKPSSLPKIAASSPSWSRFRRDGGAVVRRLAGRRSRGASTITMQLAAMLDPRHSAHRRAADRDAEVEADRRRARA